MDIEIDAGELIELSVAIGVSAADIVPLATAVVKKSALELEGLAKDFCPVDTGYLRSTIGTDLESGGSDITAVVGPTADYGAYVEFGTYRMAPQMYMGPAFDIAASGFAAAMEKLGDVRL